MAAEEAESEVVVPKPIRKLDQQVINQIAAAEVRFNTQSRLGKMDQLICQDFEA